MHKLLFMITMMRLSRLLQYKSEIFEGLDSDSTSYGRNKEGYLGFRQMIADMVYEHPDTAKYQQTNIEYDKDGDAVKAYMAVIALLRQADIS